MKPLRIVNLVVLVLCLVVATFFAYQNHLKDQEVRQYKMLSELSDRAFQVASEKFWQTKGELEDTKTQLIMAKTEVGRLNISIAALEKDGLRYKDEISRLAQERDRLVAKIDRLERINITLQDKFHDLDQLRKAVKLVTLEKRTQARLAKLEMLKRLDEMASLYGNKGFLVKGGEATFIKAARIKVELEPVTKVSYNIESEK
ncbi:MAG: hypothetical protein V1727_05200 [Candidatus Omnitrophota bacterium]